MTPAEFARCVDMESFFVNVSPKDRASIEKHLAVVDAEPTPDHGRLWRRLALGMRRLGPLRPQATGQRAVQFFAPDGKYRLQVFALEDLRDDLITVYAADALDAAVAAGVLDAPAGDGGGGVLTYEVCELPGVTISVERLTAATSTSAPDYYRHMVGWNRKAVRVMLPTRATAAQVRALEAVCALSVAPAERLQPVGAH